MANWDKISDRANVDDRRGSSGGMIGGVSLAAVALVAVFTLLSGGDANQVLENISQLDGGVTSQQQTTEFDGLDSYEVYVGKVVGSGNAMWQEIFAQNNLRYTDPNVVLFRDATQSGCGVASAGAGPHYCPSDQTIYLDERFFDELSRRFGGSSGDVAQAYVLSHELGHHVQNQLGALGSGSSVALELQADCYAGIWARYVSNSGVISPDEIEQAMSAAAAVGDDNIQERTSGYVDQESWTHGSSEQRVQAFSGGYDTGQPSRCEF